MRIGYCTNVHAGASFDGMLASLARGGAVRQRLGDDRLGVGLWLSGDAARDAADRTDELRRRLDELALTALTFNAFPFGDFHGPRVKHAVYRPNWGDEARLRYTLDVARVAAAITPPREEVSISTLPVAWRGDATGDTVKRAAAHLRRLGDELERLRDRTGRTIRIDLEPEPGCLLDSSESVVGFFDQHLPGRDSGELIGVCHDVCHAAVMFEDQREVLSRYARAGVRVGKVQISNAITAEVREAGSPALGAFAEDRYLHQAGVRNDHGFRLFEDLPDALRDAPPGTWRVHFHLPVFLDRVGALGTTRDQILPAIKAARELHAVEVFEIETYAWGVLPPEHRAESLEEGIAREIRWLRDAVRGERTPA